MQLPRELVLATEEEAAAFPFRDLVRAANAVSERYRGERPRTGRLTKAECVAWAAVRMPATWAATTTVCRELQRLDAALQPESVLDLGAGLGSGIHASCETFPSVQRATAMEGEPALIAMAGRFAAVSSNAAVRSARWLERDLTIGPPFPEHDLVLLAWVAGEIDAPARALVIERAWQAAARALIVIEPGTPRGFETVRAAREQLGAAGAQLVAPCPAAGPCGAPPGEWCHFAARVERSAIHRRLKGGELSYEDEKFSYLIATRQAARRAAMRIVRHPRHEPGLVRLTVCTGEEWRTLEIRKRDRENYPAARKARWGEEWI